MRTRHCAFLVSLALAALIGGCGSTKTAQVPPSPPSLPEPPPPPPAPAFPTLDQPLFVDACYFIIPNGKDRRITQIVGLDEQGNLVARSGEMFAESMADLMKKLAPALKTQEVDPNVAQLVCFPTKPEAHGSKHKASPKTPPASLDKDL